MSDYRWFVIKSFFFYLLIGFSVWLLRSGWPLFALLLQSSWTDSDDEEEKKP